MHGGRDAQVLGLKLAGTSQKPNRTTLTLASLDGGGGSELRVSEEALKIEI